ncbi:MAG TPA: arginine deiminase family protein [Pyrinomonadaceae bacterium]|jgi:dimethylargininase
MLTAITRAVSPAIANCELTYLSRQRIDATKAMQQQKDYERCLADLGLKVISLPSEPDYPDSVFVEDTAVVVDEVAVIPKMGAASRRREVETIAPVIADYRPLKFITGNGTLEGGDVVMVGRKCFVGISTRTNVEGIAQLDAYLSPYDYQVIPMRVTGCLHLTTGFSYLGRQTVLANRSWVDVSGVHGFEIIDVPPEEPWAANALLIDGVVILTASSSRTAAMLRERGFDIRTVDVSELEKAEAGLTCMSIIFDGSKKIPHTPTTDSTEHGLTMSHKA